VKTLVNRRQACALIAAVTAPGAFAQSADFPNKPIKIIVPSVPGGLIDLSARLIAPKLTGSLGVPIVVENRPGAGMAIGTAMAARSPADGYTLLLAHDGAVIINPVIVPDTPYSTKSFVPLAQVWDTSMILIVNKDVPASNFAELDAYMKKNAGKPNYPVADTIGELMSDTLKQATGWTFTRIQYKGNADRIRSLMSGETQLSLLSAPDAVNALPSGRVRAIAISALARNPKLPTVPTLDESGLKGFTLKSWGGLFAPAGTPPAIVRKLSAEARKALAEPDVVAQIESGGSEIGHGTAEQFSARIESDIQLWRRLAEARGMKTYDT
jgi:tripartite-type tricarboxylate transporter receptor subunit TctC